MIWKMCVPAEISLHQSVPLCSACYGWNASFVVAIVAVIVVIHWMVIFIRHWQSQLDSNVMQHDARHDNLACLARFIPNRKCSVTLTAE